MKYKFATRANSLKGSEIRELLKLTEMPDIISFAGGLPAPELFPTDKISDLTKEIIDKEGGVALQYSATEGFVVLREIIANERMKLAKVNTTKDNVLITAGSQQAIDFCARLFLNDGDYVICENPSYLGALNVFNTFNAKYLPVEMDDNGMIVESLEAIIQAHPEAKLVYTIPDFQNPTGRTMSVERRKKLVELANKYQLVIMEDNPYGELIFDGERFPSIKSFDTEERVIYMGSFSKTFCPGYRVGWACAADEIIQKMIMLKQVADLQCSTIVQREVAYYMLENPLDGHIADIVNVYKKRRDVMLESIKQYFPSNVKYTFPLGGLFTWVEVDAKLNAADILVDALKQKVAFVPGGAFYPLGDKKNFLRLNYSNMPEDRIIEGIKRLGDVLKSYA